MDITTFYKDGKALPASIFLSTLKYKEEGVSFLSFRRTKVDLSKELISLEIVGQETKNNKGFIGSAAGGVVGGALLGPVGLLAGALSFGNSNKTKVTVLGTIRNGCKFMSTMPYCRYTALLNYAIANSLIIGS